MRGSAGKLVIRLASRGFIEHCAFGLSVNNRIVVSVHRGKKIVDALNEVITFLNPFYFLLVYFININVNCLELNDFN